MAEQVVGSPAQFARPAAPEPTSGVDQPTLDGPPTTGHQLIDSALAQYAAAPGEGAAEQAANLSSLHDVLSTVLEQSRGSQGSGVQTPIPGLRSGQHR